MAQTFRVFEQNGDTKVSVDAIIAADGGLTISGYDLGTAPMETYGREDLEYELTIAAGEMPKAIAALLRSLMAQTGTPITTLRAALDAYHVGHKFRFVP